MSMANASQEESAVELVNVRVSPIKRGKGLRVITELTESTPAAGLTAYENLQVLGAVFCKRPWTLGLATLSLIVAAAAASGAIGQLIALSQHHQCEVVINQVLDEAAAVGCSVEWEDRRASCAPAFTLPGCSAETLPFQEQANREIAGINTQVHSTVVVAAVTGVLIALGSTALCFGIQGRRAYLKAYQEKLGAKTSDLSEQLLAIRAYDCL